MAKSLTITYLLWFFGGLFGLHHFYLHRDRHGFIYWLTFGGYFGLAWIRDLWRIPEYVRDFNEDRDYMEKLSYLMKAQKKPESGIVRLCGEIIIADILGYIVVGSIPYQYFADNEPLLSLVYALIVPFACTLGVHTVGNVGRHQGSFLPAMVGAYLTSPMYIYFGVNSIFWSSLAATVFFNLFAKKWRRSYPKRRSTPRRVVTLAFFGCLYLSLYASWFYFNCSIVEENSDERIKCRDAAMNFWRSPAFVDFRRTMGDLWTFIKIHGWTGFREELIKAFDPQGETNALNTLNVTEKATQDEITAAYRKLAREWHPDRHKDPIKKAEAQEKFIEIQQAFEVLSKIKSKRLNRNKRNRENVMKSPSSQSDQNHVKQEL